MGKRIQTVSIVLFSLSCGWILAQWHSSQSWAQGSGNPPPAGDYELALVANDKEFVLHRLDHKSGRMWHISGTDWVELTQQ